MPDPLETPPPAAPITPPAPPPDPAASPPPASPPPPAAPPVSATSWPTDWRESFSKSRNDEKLATRLGRYASPEAALDALISVQNKISAGELRSNQPFPDKGTPEEQTAWRRSAGVPDAPEKYEVNLGDGLVVGEEDKPIVDSFLKAAHGLNVPASQVNGMLKWYFNDVLEGQMAERHEKDEQIREQVEDQLRTEWGGDFRKNKAIIEAYLQSGPPGVKDLMFGARLADGTPLASNLDVLRFLADKGREFNPTVSLVPADPSTAIASIADEMSALMRASQAPKGSPEYKKYWQDGGDKRYRELVEVRDRMAKRAA